MTSPGCQKRPYFTIAPGCIAQILGQQKGLPDIWDSPLSGRRDSDPRMSAWKADALPLGDARMKNQPTGENLKFL
jgi:hypothetical protein